MAEPQHEKGEKDQLNQELELPAGGPYKIALLCGGASGEREVSLSSANNVEEALTLQGHDVIKIDTAAPDVFDTLQKSRPDVAFIALHGRGGEDGTIQAVLEILGIPYTGSGVLGSALAMDKHRTKIIYESLGLNTAEWVLLKTGNKDAAEDGPQRILDKLSLPVVVKPSDDGSSLGITIVREREALGKALAKALAVDPDVLVEQYIKGTEITISVIGSSNPQALPAIEIIPKNEFYDYESKYTDEGSKHIIPARVSEEVLAKASEAAIMAHEAIGCFGVSRTDMIVDEKDKVWIIETNTIPGMTKTSLLPDAARHAGIDSQTLYELFITWALERAKKEKG